MAQKSCKYIIPKVIHTITEAYAGNNDRASNVIMKELTKEYICEGCTLVTDNVYDNLDLALCLIRNKAHLVQTLRQNVNGVLLVAFWNTKIKNRQIVGEGSNIGTRMTDMNSCGWDPEKIDKVIQLFLILLYNHNIQHTDYIYIYEKMSNYFRNSHHKCTEHVYVTC
jgi:hypothetical protein